MNRYLPGERVPKSIATYGGKGIDKNALKKGFAAGSDGKYYVSEMDPPKTLPLKRKRKSILPQKEKKAAMALDKCSTGKKRVGKMTAVSKVKKCTVVKRPRKETVIKSKLPPPLRRPGTKRKVAADRPRKPRTPKAVASEVAKAITKPTAKGRLSKAAREAIAQELKRTPPPRPKMTEEVRQSVKRARAAPIRAAIEKVLNTPPPKPPGRSKMPKLDIMQSLARRVPVPVRPKPLTDLQRAKAMARREMKKDPRAGMAREVEIALSRLAYEQGGL